MPITLPTANDLVNGDKVVRQQIAEFGEVAEPYILDSTPDVLSIGRRCVEDGCEFHWKPYSLHPTMTTASGKVVTLVSRDCCPYLDEYEPDYYSPAIAAVTPTNEKSVTWDPEGPTYDEPKPYREPYVRPVGRHPMSVDPDPDDSYDDDFVWPTAELAAHVAALNQRGSNSCESLVAPHRRSVSLAAAEASNWIEVFRFNPQPIKLSPEGVFNIHVCLLEVAMAPSARKAVTGDGICIGLNYKTTAFVHPHSTKW